MQKAKVIIIATLILTFFAISYAADDATDNMFLSYKDNPLPHQTCILVPKHQRSWQEDR